MTRAFYRPTLFPPQPRVARPPILEATPPKSRDKPTSAKPGWRYKQVSTRPIPWLYELKNFEQKQCSKRLVQPTKKDSSSRPPIPSRKVPLLLRGFLFPSKKLYERLPIVLVREAIFLFVSAKRAPVNKAPLALLEKCRDRLHEPTTRSQTIPGMDINMTTPEASGTVIGIAIPSHLRPALPAHKILNLFLKLFGRHHRSVLLQEDSIWSN